MYFTTVPSVAWMHAATAPWKYSFISRASSSESMPSDSVVKPAMSLKRMVSFCFSAPGWSSLRSLSAANFFTSLGERYISSDLHEHAVLHVKANRVDRHRTEKREADLHEEDQPGKPDQLTDENFTAYQHDKGESEQRHAYREKGPQAHQSESGQSAEDDDDPTFCLDWQPAQPVATQDVEEHRRLDFHSKYQRRVVLARHPE